MTLLIFPGQLTTNVTNVSAVPDRPPPPPHSCQLMQSLMSLFR